MQACQAARDKLNFRTLSPFRNLVPRTSPCPGNEGSDDYWKWSVLLAEIPENNSRVSKCRSTLLQSWRVPSLISKQAKQVKEKSRKIVSASIIESFAGKIRWKQSYLSLRSTCSEVYRNKLELREAIRHFWWWSHSFHRTEVRIDERRNALEVIYIRNFKEISFF